MAVVERQPAVAHVLTVDAFGSRGDTDDLCFLHICACWEVGHKKDTSAEGRTSRDEQVCRSRGDVSSVALFLKPGCQHSKPTCCHDDSRQDFPSRMRRAKVVCELTEFVHHQTRDGISQNLKTHTGVYTRKHGHTHTNTKLLLETSASSSVSLPQNSEHLSESIHREKRGCPPQGAPYSIKTTVFQQTVTVLTVETCFSVPQKSQTVN